jgi:hypothetical protein
MLIAQQKLKENIAEYILYMWQVEDMIRACNLDIEVIQERIVNPMVDEDAIRKEIRIWYADLISKMKLQGKEKMGHLRDLDDVFIEINYLHGTLIGLLGDEKYKGIYQTAMPLMEDFKKRANTNNITEIEICFNGLYAKLMLRLQNKPITPETEEAFNAFAQVLGYLSVKYKLMKEGKLV